MEISPEEIREPEARLILSCFSNPKKLTEVAKEWNMLADTFYAKGYVERLVKLGLIKPLKTKGKRGVKYQVNISKYVDILVEYLMKNNQIENKEETRKELIKAFENEKLKPLFEFKEEISRLLPKNQINIPSILIFFTPYYLLSILVFYSKLIMFLKSTMKNYKVEDFVRSLHFQLSLNSSQHQVNPYVFIITSEKFKLLNEERIQILSSLKNVIPKNLKTWWEKNLDDMKKVIEYLKSEEGRKILEKLPQALEEFKSDLEKII